MSQIEQLNPAPAEENKLPQTQEELHNFVAASLMKILSIPENAAILATTITQAQLRALTVTVTKDEGLRAPELALVRTEYEGCIRAEVTEPDATTGLLDVILTKRSETDPEQWTTDIGFDDAQKASLKRAVLAQTAVPTDVFFITTSLAVNKAHQEAAELLFDRSAEINKMADEAETLAKTQQAQ